MSLSVAYTLATWRGTLSAHEDACGPGAKAERVAWVGTSVMYRHGKMFDEGSALCSTADGALYWVHDKRARYVPTVEILEDHFAGVQPRLISDVDLAELRWGANVPRASFDKNMDMAVWREFVCSRLTGTGVEFGAGPRPLAIPPHCKVNYVDIFSDEEILDKSSSARGISREARFVGIDVVDTMDEMSKIPVKSLDFVAASHVIEHVRSPLQVMRNAFERLKLGGQLILIVPDRDRTFDSERPVTSLDHHLSDLYMPSRERDFEHYIEFCRFVERRSPVDAVEQALTLWQTCKDTHLHTFTPSSFDEIARWACKNIGFSSYEIWDGYAAKNSNEFYVALRS